MHFCPKAILFSLLASITGLALPAAAEPLDPANIPANAKWVMHFDADAIQASNSWKTFDEYLKKNPEAQQKIAEIETLFNVRLPEDLHDITLLGPAFEDATNVIQVSARVDRGTVERLLSLNQAYASSAYGSHNVLSWEDKGKILYGAFGKNDRMIISQSKEQVQASLDVLDKKADALKPTSNLAEGSKPGVLFYVAGDELGKLKQLGQAKSPLITQMQSAWASLSEVNEEILLRMQVLADTADTAQKMKKSVEGLLAMLTLAAGETNAKPELKLLAEMADKVQTSTEQSMVKLEWRMPLSRIKEIAQLAQQAKAAEKAPK